MNIKVGDIFEVQGRIPVIVTDMDADSRTVKVGYWNGCSRSMDAGLLIDMIIRKLGSMEPQFARIKNIVALVAI